MVRGDLLTRVVSVLDMGTYLVMFVGFCSIIAEGVGAFNCTVFFRSGFWCRFRLVYSDDGAV